MTRIGILHPNLGIGGAERLILDVTLSLKRNGHSVSIFTNHFDKNHCFSETSNLPIQSSFDWIPDSILGGFKVYLASLKIILLTIYLIFWYFNDFDIILVDQIAILSAPILRIFGFKVLFYCHFPDQFLSDHSTFLKKIYRFPIDIGESLCFNFPNMIFVNSEFTKKVLLNAFPRIKAKYFKYPTWIEVLYPCINTNIPQLFDNEDLGELDKYEFLLVSLNRFDPKKQIERAIMALSLLKVVLEPRNWLKVHLVIAGGCDRNCPSDLKYYADLNALAISLGLLDAGQGIENKITFIKNPSDRFKYALLSKVTALIYTPDYEHFGIVPLEAMLSKTPVLASASGGPLETIVDSVTGFHISNFPGELVKKLKDLIENPERRILMGEAGYEHCIKNFSFKAMDDKLKESLEILSEQTNFHID